MLKLFECYDKLEEVIGAALRTMCALLLGALLTVFITNIFNRFFPFTSMAWFEEIITLCFGWMSFLGAAELWRQKSHFKVDFFLERLKKSETVALANFITDLTSLIFFVIITVYSIRWIIGIPSTTPALAMPTSVLYVSVPIAMLLMSIMSLRDLAEDAMCFIKK